MTNRAYPPSICPGIPRLGKCPHGWSTCTFGEVLRVVERPATTGGDTEYQLVNAKRNRGGIVARERLKGCDIKTKDQYFVAAGDFLIANRQIIHGACGIVPPGLDGALVSGEYTVLHANDALLLAWFTSFTHTTYFQQTCFHSSIGVDVEKMVFKLDWWLKHKLHVPPVGEQKKIADVLSAWDDAIGQTRALIAAGKCRKTSLMQQLLTRIKRLSGFMGTWRELALTQACQVSSSGIDKKTTEGESAVRLCNYTHVYYNDSITSQMDFMPASATQSEMRRFELRRNDILLTKDSETPDDIAKCAVVTEDLPSVLCGYHLALLRPNDAVDGSFLCQMLNTHGMRMSFTRFANGVTRFGLPSAAFDQITVRLPPLPEQRAIAAVLTTADEEIESLQAKCAALERQKKGLMQKLLSGEVRVMV